MNRFINKIQDHMKILGEAPEDETETDLAGNEATPPPPPEDTTEPTALPEEPAGDDDTAKLKIDYVEMIRKALIMAPKHIDDVDYARLTKIVDAENLEEMQELVSRIVRNNYPHSDIQ